MTGVATGSVVRAFLLAFPALFSIINPLAGALIFHEATQRLPPEQRRRVAAKVGFYSLVVMLLALWTGSYVLAFFGISLAALRIAGGVVIALFGWELLKSPETSESNKRKHATPISEDIAFFPLTLPITTGPGTISVVVALGADRPDDFSGALMFFAGASAAAAAMAVVITLLYRWADQFVGLLGRSGERILTRLTAFLLLCIGVQILINGIDDVLNPLLHH